MKSQYMRGSIIAVVMLVLVGSLAAAEYGAPDVPVLMDHLQLWLRSDSGVVTSADGATVTSWQDQSGKGNHALADADSRPRVLLNAAGTLQGIHFDTESFLRVPHHDDLNAGHALTFFAVYRNGKGNRLLQKKSDATVSKDSWFVISTQGLAVSGTYRQESPTLFPGNRDDIYVVCHVFSAETETINMYAAGEHVWRLEGVLAQEPNGDDLFIGKRDNPSGSEASWSGDLFEMIIYDTALDDEARSQVEQYLINKYAQ